MNKLSLSLLALLVISPQALNAGFQNGRQIPDKVSILNDTGEPIYAVAPSFRVKNGDSKEAFDKVEVQPDNILSFKNETGRVHANHCNTTKNPTQFVFFYDKSGKALGSVLFPGYDEDGPVIHYGSSVWPIQLSDLKKRQKMNYLDYFTVEHYTQECIIKFDEKPLFYDYFLAKRGEPYRKAFEDRVAALKKQYEEVPHGRDLFKAKL